MLLGIGLGILMVLVVVSCFTETTLVEFAHKLGRVSWGEMVLTGLTAMLLFLVFMVVHAVMHEVGHLVGGLLTGYRFVSFRIFRWTFIRCNGQLTVKHFSISGTGGQCLLSPPDVDPEHTPVFWYNMGGVMLTLFLVLAAIPLFWVFAHPLAKMALALFCLSGFFFLVLNGIPMCVNGLSNDANNMRYIMRTPAARRAMVIQLKTNAMIQQGVRPRDLPEAWTEYEVADCYGDPLLLPLRLIRATWLLDQERWQEAYDELEEMHCHGDEMIALYADEVDCELLFVSLVLGYIDEALDLYTPELREYIMASRAEMSSKERVLFAVTLILEGDESLARAIYWDVVRMRDTYLMQGEVRSDIALMEALAELESLPLDV